MLILRKIILQLGAIFLLVTLKTHGGLARSVTNSELLKRPDLNSRTYEKAIKESNFSDSVLSPVTSANETEVKDLTAQLQSIPSNVTLTKNVSSFAISPLVVIANESETDVENSEMTFNQTEDSNGANNNITTMFKRTNDSYFHENIFLSSEQHDGNNFHESSLDADAFPAMDEHKSENQTAASKRQSLVAAGRRAIKNLGNELKKLKSNVDSFKQNLRKFLFENELPVFHRNGSSSSPENDTVFPSRYNSNVTLVSGSSNTNSYASNDIFDESMNMSITSAPRVQTFAKISAAAANMSEASKRMGDFIKKQYWDSKEKYEQNAHEALMNRGKSFH